MNRLSRKFAAVFTVLGLLFAQWAVAAFPCPVIARALAAPAAAEEVMPCHKPDGQAATGSALCHKHCQQDDNATGDQAVNLPVAFVPAYSVSLPPARTTQVRQLIDDIDQHAGAPPPVSLLYSRFQI